MPSKHSLLGAYLKSRRTRLDPEALGYPISRRRTPGLRREEVAQRASISPTWYTWLEQGRGGPPSACVLDRIAYALMLNEAEREHIYLLALGHPPVACYEPIDGIKPRLQAVLDSMHSSPAVVRTASWDIVAWNRAATAMLMDFASIPSGERNTLRLLFLKPESRARHTNWEEVVRFTVALFRRDVAKAGATNAVESLVTELCQKSREFQELWHENDIKIDTEGAKSLIHPRLGEIELETSRLAVDGKSDLIMWVNTPTNARDAARLRSLHSDL